MQPLPPGLRLVDPTAEAMPQAPEAPLGVDQDVPVPQAMPQALPAGLTEVAPAPPAEPDMMDRLGAKIGQRVDKVQRGSEMYSAGEIGYPEFAMRGIGFGVGALYDTVGEGLMTVLGELTPDSLEDLLKEQIAAGGTKLMSTELAQDALNVWNSMSQREKDNWSDVGNIASFILPGTAVTKNVKVPKGGNVGAGIKASAIKSEKKALGGLVLDNSPLSVKARHKELGRDIAKQTVTNKENEVLNTVLSIKGISSSSSRKKIMESLNKEIDRLSGQIKSTLAKTDTPVTLQTLNKNIDEGIDLFLKKNPEYTGEKLLPDLTPRINEAIDIALTKFDGKASSLIDVRREFDRLIERSFSKDIHAGDHVSRPLVAAIRNSMNDAMQGLAPNSQIKAAMRRQHHAMLAADNLGYNMATKPTIAQKIAEIPQQHPYLSLGLATGTGALPGILNTELGVLGALGATAAYGATRPAVRRIAGTALEPLPVKRGLLTGAAQAGQEEQQ